MTERYTTAVMFNGFLAAGRRLGIEAQVRKHASPALAQLLDKPPLPTAMIPGSTCDVYYETVVRLLGRPALRAIGKEAMRFQGLKLMQRLVDSTFALYGRTPAALFTHLDSLIPLIVNNIEVSWKPETARAGSIKVRPSGAPARLSYALWEGYFECFLELAGEAGTVEQFQLAPDGTSGTARIWW